MKPIFLTVLGMSGTASLVILAVLLVRLCLRRTPKVLSYALWAAVLFQLLCPVSIHSPVGTLPAVQVAPTNAGTMSQVSFDLSAGEVNITVGGPQIDNSGPAEPPSVSAVPDVSEPDTSVQTGRTLPSLWTVLGAVWLAGVLLLLGYSAVSLLLFRRKLIGSVPLEGEKNVRLADHIPSPFVLGLVRPKIYLPSNLPESEREYILLHERTHIRRFDHVTRALAWLALSIHWFNPLVWLAFHLAGKDMEMSCDEAVLRKMGRDIRADYSTSLLRLSIGGKLPAGPLAFGGGDTQKRIKNVLNYKKPALWIIVIGLIGVLLMTVSLATSRPAVDYAPEGTLEPGPAELWVDYEAELFNGSFQGESVEAQMEEFPGAVFRWTQEKVTAAADGRETTLFTGAPIWKVYFCDLTGDGKRELCAMVDGASLNTYIVAYDYASRTLYEWNDKNNTRSYSLRLEGDQLWAESWPWNEDEEPHSGPLVLVPASIGESVQLGILLNGAYWPTSDLTMSMDQTSSGPFVRVSGSVYGIELSRAIWHTEGDGYYSLLGEHPGGELTMEYRFAAGGCTLGAWWTDDTRTSVALSTKITTMYSSYIPNGWWEFTVDLSADTVTAMKSYGGETTLPAPVQYYPDSIMDAEAVRAARIAAKVLTAAEDYYNNHIDSWQAPPSYDPVYLMEEDYVRIVGLGDSYIQWDASIDPDGPGSLYFARDPAYYCPRLTGMVVEGGAYWPSENTFRVNFNVNDERVPGGTISGFRIEFTIDMNTAIILERDFRSMVEGETLELTDTEMVEMAVTLSGLMEGAKQFYAETAAQAAASQPPASEPPAATPVPTAAPTPKPTATVPPTPVPTPVPANTPEPKPSDPAPSGTSDIPYVAPPDLPGNLIFSMSYGKAGSDFRTGDFHAVPGGGNHIRCWYKNLTAKPIWVYLRRVDGNDEPGGAIVARFPLEGNSEGFTDYTADDADTGTYYVWIQSQVAGNEIIAGGAYASQY